jgi:hypothetical protein
MVSRPRLTRMPGFRLHSGLKSLSTSKNSTDSSPLVDEFLSRFVEQSFKSLENAYL